MPIIKDQINPNRLRVGEIIGSGGFGIVFAGTFDQEKGKTIDVAIKRVLIPSGAAEAVKKDASEAVIDEASLLCTVNHKNIIECYGIVLDAGAVDVAGQQLGLCLVLERCTISLRDALDNLRSRFGGSGGGGGGGSVDGGSENAMMSKIEEMLLSPDVCGKVCFHSSCHLRNHEVISSLSWCMRSPRPWRTATPRPSRLLSNLRFRHPIQATNEHVSVCAPFPPHTTGAAS
jgi:hypothetical protein